MKPQPNYSGYDRRFSGKRVRQDSAKLAAIKKRDRRLRKVGHSIMEFAS